MLSKEVVELSKQHSIIRDIFEYGMKRAKEVGAENVFDFSIGNPSVPAPKEIDETALRLLKTADPVDIHGYTSNAGVLEVRENIAKSLNERGCEVTVYPAGTKAEEIIASEPDGIMLSNGPGDPETCVSIIEEIKKLYNTDIPIFAICLGHQLMALANGAKTYKLKYGHRGGNHPVKDLTNNRVYISSQNHGYAVSDEGLPDCIEVTHRSVNDGTIEGIRHKTLPIQAVQYHPEASPGPKDNFYLFAEFTKAMEEFKNDK